MQSIALPGGGTWLAPAAPARSLTALTEVPDGKCSASPEALHDVQGQHHPQEQICHSQASGARTWSLTMLAKGVTLPCPAALDSGGP